MLASNNAGKLAELQALLAPAGVELIAQRALGVAEADEPHHTFIENALAKARHAAHAVGGAALADDSGLCVDALGGAPGVHSAHFASIGEPGGAGGAGGGVASATDRETRRAAQDAANNALLFERLQGITDRRARFVGTLVAVRSADDPEPLIAVGRWFGEIVGAPRGAGGFGYDRCLFIPALGCTVAELDTATKNRHSHRALAALQMVASMREAWRVG